MGGGWAKPRWDEQSSYKLSEHVLHDFSIMLTMVQLAIQHGSISSNTVSDLLGHASNKFMATRIHSNGFEDLFLPWHKLVPTILQQPELWLSPAPDMLLGVELRAIRGPRSQKTNVGCSIGPLCRRCPQQFFTIQQNVEGGFS